MKKSTLGKTGLDVSRLGVGLAEIGYELSLSPEGTRLAGEVLNGALDRGVNFLDTAECYKVSEELVGLAVAHRRDEYVLATKAGHLGGGAGSEWTYETVTENIDRSLKRMRTDRVDIVQLHSCGVRELEKGDVMRALQDARKAGKTRFIGYSGDNQAAHWAVDSGLFDTLQTSFNLADQHARTTGLLAKTEAGRMGVIIKRPIAGATWGAAKAARQGRVRGYDDPYLKRCQEMLKAGPVPGEPADAVEFALGFTLSHPEVDVAIVGTKDPGHMAANLEYANSGRSVPPQAIEEAHRRFEARGKDWTQLT
jgi:hypothetical protein